MRIARTFGQLAATLLLATSALQGIAAPAPPITVTFAVNITQAYDYVLRAYVPITPIQSVGSFAFSTENSRIDDYGTTTIASFFGPIWPFGTTWASPVTALIPQHPSTGAYGSFNNAYTFPNVSDYPSTFIEQVAAQSNTYMLQGDVYSAYHIELRATRRSDPRSGIGLDDYAFDRDSTIKFLQGFIGQTGQEIYFNESYQVYSFVNGQPIYEAGRDYSDYSVRILEVSVVPELSTHTLLSVGLFLVLFSLRRTTAQSRIGASGA